MNTLSNCTLDIEDRKTYAAWLRGTVAAYGAVVLFSIAAVMALPALTNAPNAAEYLTTAVALASP